MADQPARLLDAFAMQVNTPVNGELALLEAFELARVDAAVSMFKPVVVAAVIA